MTEREPNLSADALQIWQAGVEAVKPHNLFAAKVHLDGAWLSVEDVLIDLSKCRRLVVVGAGKAAAAMALALQRQVLAPLRRQLPKLELRGWINCPAGTFTPQDQQLLGDIQLHAARPAGRNEPTQEGVLGTQQILDLVRDCDHRDVVLCLLSGGGSALLVAPPAGISLVDKQAVAREIAAAGGNIEQLNAVRRVLSLVKGGGLARACRAGQLVTLIISDVLGDPLETIASGPTLLEASAEPVKALQVLRDLQLESQPNLANVVRFLENSWSSPAVHRSPAPPVQHVILGNNADAVDAAGVQAVELGYRYVMQAARESEGDVLQLAHTAADAVQQLVQQQQIDCWISGGEPTVRLPAAGSGKGGRNQQLALAVLATLQDRGWPQTLATQRELLFLSGGTDGEDGPTDAAGAWIDQNILRRSQTLGLQPEDFLQRADAYHFFEQAGGLLRSGPTGTNVCDLRIALVAPRSRRDLSH